MLHDKYNFELKIVYDNHVHYATLNLYSSHFFSSVNTFKNKSKLQRDLNTSYKFESLYCYNHFFNLLQQTPDMSQRMIIIGCGWTLKLYIYPGIQYIILNRIHCPHYRPMVISVHHGHRCKCSLYLWLKITGNDNILIFIWKGNWKNI